MAEAEDVLRREYILGLKPNQRRFFIDAGYAWKADKKNTVWVKTPKMVQLNPGDMVLRHPQKFNGGPEGWFDAVGWDEVVITPDMVGKTVAVFCGDELKSKNDRLRPLQRLLGQVLKSMGGVWRIIKPGDVSPPTRS